MPEGVRRRFCQIKKERAASNPYQPESRKKLENFETRSKSKHFELYIPGSDMQRACRFYGDARRSPGRGHGGNPRNTKTHRPPAIKWLGPLACPEIQRQAGVELSRAGWWRAQCDRELKQAIAQARRGVRESALRVTLGRRAGARRRDRPREPQGRAFRELRHGGPEGRSVPSDGHLREQGAREARRAQAPLLRRRQVRSRWAHNIDRVERLPPKSPAIEAPARYPPARAIRLRGRRWAYDARDEGARRQVRPRLRAPQDVPFHVCSAAGHPWHDERGFTRSRSLTREEFKRLYAIWKSPGRARVCAVINEKNVKGINLRRKSCLRQRDDRLARALALLRPAVLAKGDALPGLHRRSVAVAGR